MLKTPSLSRSDKKKNPLKLFKKSGKDVEPSKTAPNTPEEEEEHGVTVVANEIDPSQGHLSQLSLQQVPSPLRRHIVSNSTKSSVVREEKKEDLSVQGDQPVDDVVSKTLNFFDDMCALPKIPKITSVREAENITSSSRLNLPHPETQESSYTRVATYDDVTTSPSLPSETTGNSSAAPSTLYSISRVSSNDKLQNAKPSQKKNRSQNTAHDHENFEVVLDPASMAKDEKSKSAKHKGGKRWNLISKSFASSLKKEKNQPTNGSSRNDEGSPAPESGNNKTPFMEQEVQQLNPEEVDDAPLDEEMGRLGGTIEPVRTELSSEHNTSKDTKSSTSVGGPKVLAKKIWKNCKKIPIPALHKGEHNQQSHRAEVDSEAAVARSLEAKRSLEEQDFLQMGCPQQGVEPILEENESEDRESEGGDEVDRNDKEHRSPLARTWDNIASESLSTNVSAEQKNLKNEELASVPEGQSVEVSSSHANKKMTHRRTNSLGRRLKKIQKSAYFKGPRKAMKNKKASDPKKDEKNVSVNLQSHNPASEDDLYVVATPGSGKIDNSEIPKKPKLIWKSVVDPNSGRTYYYHRKTRETTWIEPEAIKQYEIDYKKWHDATEATIEHDAAVNETKKSDEFEHEEKTSLVSTRPASSSKTISPDETEKNGKTTNNDIHRTSTPPLAKKEVPLQMSDIPVKEGKKHDSSSQQKDAVGEGKNAGLISKPEKEAKTRTVKTKQAVDESKPFDESTPFDEPLADKDPGLLFLPRSPARFGRTMTYTSKASARSALTDRTEKIKNTGKGKFSSIIPINENTASATNLSSFHGINRLGRGIASHRVPSRVPVHRERQLMVEELTDARLSAESYEGNAGEKRGRIVRGRAREIDPAPEVYDGDNDTYDDYGASTFDNDTYGTDSVSALSENDTDYLSRRDNFDQARRRALDAAIEIEDWDLAAALSDGMRAVNLPGGYEKAHSSWNQSELDKFIANNDWNAVKSYIARMREQSKKEQGNRTSGRKGQSSTANKRVGSRSQMQHRDVMSESSWSGSDSQSSYETYDSESEI
mmetsp:Transcript_26456/g.62156  ORF Transcript_26456/g.62156 Transcript_26456/m.62156 type:complete len:1047 (-) Transcript_26456:1307-4447(-)|eukprot:CAMPEP_0197197432 /NCGR_PEP_ID=MMETSP1423-20130617/32862_1 /TAXON_ID=476441 /ORGANISM="Pseudo-nitzschia heimii, Strain UNC1101" /LENGTH=1046 /DNA_ID=CAMNT_0042651253 /DNA_START=245 /DNA_END=3385 /DNA_ORIENTATION=-